MLFARKILINCPCCNSETNYYKTPIATFNMNLKTDLSYSRGGNRPAISHCKNCDYIYFDKTIFLDNNELKIFINSKEYKELFNTYYKIKSFYIIFKIYEYMQQDKNSIDTLLLFNYYYTKDLKDLYLLLKNYININLVENSNKELFKMKMLEGEYFRRIGDFEKAKNIFESIVKLSKDFNGLSYFQLKLIKNKNTNLEIYKEDMGVFKILC